MQVGSTIHFGQVLKKTFPQPMGLYSPGDAYADVEAYKETLKQKYNAPTDVVLIKHEAKLEKQKKLPWAIYVLTEQDGVQYRQDKKQRANFLKQAIEKDL